MATRAIKPKREDTILTGWQSMPEQAPSVLRQDQPTTARVLAMIGVLLSAMGALAMLAPAWSRNYVISPGWGFFFLTLGLGLILFHAFCDRDLQFRRMYAFLGLGLMLVGVALRLLPLGGSWGALFLPYGLSGLIVGLLFVLGALRLETDPQFQLFFQRVIAGVGWIMLAFAAIYAQFNQAFLLQEGILLLILGTWYVGGFIGMQDLGSALAYKMGLALGLYGGAVFGISLLRSLAPWVGVESDFFFPSGLLLMILSLLPMGISLGVCSDRPLIVLTRRELAAFFYSPIAYLVLFGMTVIGCIMFGLFVLRIVLQGGMFEPIVSVYIYNLIPVIGQMFVVPIITMRLLSEEQRSGTLEVLLTAPVNETTIVLAKFIAVMVFSMMTWLGWWLFMVALRVLGGQDFDYRPIISFLFAAVATGGGVLSMGLFFSSLTRNQIIAAVMTYAGMIVFLCAHIAPGLLPRGSIWVEVIAYVSYIDLWMMTLDGILAPRFFLFHISITILFLFMTVKVLESRKWK